jgi:hypothetical protein
MSDETPQPSERQEAQESRRRLLLDPQPPLDTAESVQADQEVPLDALVGEDSPGVLIEATLTPEGLVVEILIPLDAVSVTVAQDDAEA